MIHVERFTKLLECETEDCWRESIINIGNEFGFEQSLIAVAHERPISLGKTFLHSNYSSQWLSIYSCNELISIDPTVAHCINRSTPLFWEPDVFSGKQQKEMYEEASHYGLRSGISLPYHGANGEIGILCFVSDASPTKQLHRHTLHLVPTLSMMRDFAFEASRKFSKRSTAPPPHRSSLDES